MIEIKFELHTRARIQAVSWEQCTFSNEILTFLNCASRYSKQFHVVLKFGGNFDALKINVFKKSILFCEYLHNGSSNPDEI